MKYHEIVAASNRRRQSNNAKITNRTTVKQITARAIDGPINRLYNDLVDALEGRLMDIKTTSTRDER
jgi:hypothetical protein